MAVELFEMAVDALGVAVGSAVNLLDLEQVVVGGGPAESWVRIWPTGSPRLPGPGCCSPTPTWRSWRRAWATTPGSSARRFRSGRW